MSKSTKHAAESTPEEKAAAKARETKLERLQRELREEQEKEQARLAAKRETYQGQLDSALAQRDKINERIEKIQAQLNLIDGTEPATEDQAQLDIESITV
jgi:uncharacterized protein YlxW (UPF0749 family)